MITFDERVLNTAYQLNETEEEICTFIEGHRDAVSHMSIAKLADATYVAPNAITRLCKKLHYDGFVALKLALRETQTSENLAQQEVLNRNFELIDAKREADVVKLLHNAKRVAFFAVGETAYVAHNFAYIFNAVDQKTQFVTYENQIIFEIEHTPGVVVFAISQSGETPQVLRIAKAAKAAGCPLISLTGLYVNSLARLADTALFSYAPRRTWHGFNFTDKTPLYIIMNALFDQYLKSAV